MTDSDCTFDELTRHAYSAAIRLLAHRDHCVAELQRKLNHRGHCNQAINAAIDELQSAGYIDEQRYVSDYIAHRISQGFGALAIRSRLRERGIDDTLVSSALDNLSVNWAEQAIAVIKRRFDAEEILSSDRKSESRIARFLQQRGFSGSESLKALQVVRKNLVSSPD